MTEKEIVKVTQVRMSVACLYLLGKCYCSSGTQFTKLKFDLQRKLFKFTFDTHWYVW